MATSVQSVADEPLEPLESKREDSLTSDRCAAMSPPRELPVAEPEEVYAADEILLEEEKFPWYDPDEWYPIRLGEVVRDRYQVLVKLGFGTASTAWLCRDLLAHRYVTLKVYRTGYRQASNESKVLEHLENFGQHEEIMMLRTTHETFNLPGQKGLHACLIYEPLGVSLKDMRDSFGKGKVEEVLVKGTVQYLPMGIDFMHRVARTVHTDIQESNVMLSLDGHSSLGQLVEDEWAAPSARKVQGDRIIYASRRMEVPDNYTFPVLCDLGEAKFGEGPFCDEAMPDLYRAPEIVLCMPWDEKIDIWALGLMIWDMFEGKHLFNMNRLDRDQTVGTHLARMVTLLGPPPVDFLERSELSSDIFDDDGNFKLNVSAPGGSLEEEEEILTGKQEEGFLTFMRKMLRWRPEDRYSAQRFARDRWLNTLPEKYLNRGDEGDAENGDGGEREEEKAQSDTPHGKAEDQKSHQGEPTGEKREASEGREERGNLSMDEQMAVVEL